MKQNKLAVLMALGLLSAAVTNFAQDDGNRPGRPPGGQRPPRQGGPEGRGRMGGSPLVAALDLDKDGTISAAEIAKASQSLAALDKNGDGQLTHDELRPLPPQSSGAAPAGAPPADANGEHPRPPGGPGGPGAGPGGPGGPGERGDRPQPPLIGALDANHDGVIDAAELANAPAALLKLDKNGDGALTPDELRPPRPEGERRGPRPAPPAAPAQ